MLGRVRMVWRVWLAVRMCWPNHPGRVSFNRMAWPNPSGMAEWTAESESSWPSPTELPNHPGRVGLAGWNILAESEWAAESSWPSPTRFTLAESPWPNPNGMAEWTWPNPNGLSLDHFGRVRLRWPSDLWPTPRILRPSELRPSDLSRVNFGRLREYFGRVPLACCGQEFRLPISLVGRNMVSTSINLQF